MGKRDFDIGSKGIDTIEEINIGGINQTILIQGQQIENPIILFLHGGPSMPIPGVSSRGRDYTIVSHIKKLIDHFTVVFWDQRGTGRSFHHSLSSSDMTIQHFVDDTLELADYLRHKFKQSKIYLAAHSWGSIIGLKAVEKQPEKFYSYIGFSQIINWTENDRLALQWAKDEAIRRGNKKALGKLESIGQPPFLDSFKQWGELRKWQQQFGSLVYNNEHTKHPGVLKELLGVLTSKDYSLKHFYYAFVAGSKLVYNHDFVKEISVVDFKSQFTHPQLPLIFIHGSHDVQIFSTLVKQYVEQLSSEHEINVFLFDHSGHAFHPIDTKAIELLLIDKLTFHHENTTYVNN